MKALNEEEWQQQRKELLEEGEVGEKFLQFFELWVNAIETELEDHANLAGCISDTFEITEAELGTVDTIAVAQLLLLFCSQWYHRDKFFDALTPIEKKLVVEALDAKLLDLREQAKLEIEKEQENRFED